MRRHQRGALSALRVTGVSLLHDVKTSNRLLRDASRKQRNCCSLCLDALNELPAVSHQGAGGARRDRTDDLMLAKHALSQLSYGPKPVGLATQDLAKMVGLGRLERPTSPLSGVRSNHLSYRPEASPPAISRPRHGAKAHP